MWGGGGGFSGGGCGGGGGGGGGGVGGGGGGGGGGCGGGGGGGGGGGVGGGGVVGVGRRMRRADVMMHGEFAWCKVFYRWSYYAAFFSIRANPLNMKLMCQEKNDWNFFLHVYERRKDTQSKRSRILNKDMRIVRKCMPVD